MGSGLDGGSEVMISLTCSGEFLGGYSAIWCFNMICGGLVICGLRVDI